MNEFNTFSEVAKEVELFTEKMITSFSTIIGTVNEESLKNYNGYMNTLQSMVDTMVNHQVTKKTLFND